MKRPNVLSGLGVDRSVALRGDPRGLADAWSRALVLPVWRSKHIVVSEEPSRVAFVRADRLGEPDRDRAIFLGRTDNATYFAVDVSEVDEPLSEFGLDDAHAILGLREVASLLPQPDGALLAYANGMMSWHRRHLYCGACGAPTVSAQGGHVRECSACEEIHFPRTDPAVIMLVTEGDACLLGRQAVWPERVYSTLAGFVEPGESLEEAVAREVYEESGIRVKDVHYHSSQPWPFPGSVMLGFTATATGRDIELQTDELEDARWFTREELRSGDGVELPSEISIARRLIEDWID